MSTAATAPCDDTQHGRIRGLRLYVYVFVCMRVRLRVGIGKTITKEFSAKNEDDKRSYEKYGMEGSHSPCPSLSGCCHGRSCFEFSAKCLMPVLLPQRKERSVAGLCKVNLNRRQRTLTYGERERYSHRTCKRRGSGS